MTRRHLYGISANEQPQSKVGAEGHGVHGSVWKALTGAHYMAIHVEAKLHSITAPVYSITAPVVIIVE